MLRPAEDTCLLIADISGYTGYLAATELEHAQDVLSDLIDTVIGTLEPTFELMGTEGDAVFVVAPLRELSGQQVLDVVDACYFAFRRRTRSVMRATTCECNACRQIPSLDLKFVVHAGPAVRSRAGRRENVTGPAVVVSHRLLKNSVSDLLGPHAYLLVTEVAAGALGLDGGRLRCSRSVERYEHIGDVPTLVIDMEARWQEAERAGGLAVSREAAALVIEWPVPATPALVWEYLLDPRRRLQWQTMLTRIDEESASGRREAGTVAHCAHGAGTFTEEILEWRPFERFTWDRTLHGYGRVRNSVSLRREGDGTVIEDLYAGPATEEQAAAWPSVRAFMDEQARIGYRNLSTVLIERVAQLPAVPSEQ